MGTDIHPVVERRSANGWERVRAPSKKDGNSSVIAQRNYDLFAILADVRNGSGFAGVATGDRMVPIAGPRGLPSDFDSTSPAHTPEECDDPKWCDHALWMGDHSESWVTLEELLAYDWQRVRRKTGIVSLPEYARWLKRGGTGGPREYCGGISGPDIVVLSEDELMDTSDYSLVGRGDKMRRLLACQVYVRVFWEETAAESVGLFYREALPWLSTLGAPGDVRLVFGFDS